MKKILTVLLILAVSAGTLFAQDAEAVTDAAPAVTVADAPVAAPAAPATPAAAAKAEAPKGTFTWTGEFRFGTDVDFLPDDPTMTGNNGYGQVVLSYDLGALNTEFTFKGNWRQNLSAIDLKTNAPGWGILTGMAEYGDGVNDTVSDYKVKGSLTLFTSEGTGGMFSPNQIDNDGTDGKPITWKPSTLYAYYYLFNRQLKLDVAYAGYEEFSWRASDVNADGFGNFDGSGGFKLNYMPAFLSGLSAGIALPGLRDDGTAAHNATGLVEDYFKQTILGVKYDTGSLAVSTTVALAPNKAEKIQVGFLYKAIPDTLTVKADAQGNNLGDFGDFGVIKFGANAEYVAKPLTAGLTFKGDGLYIDSDAGKTQASTLTVNPYVYYNIIDNALQARLPVTVVIGISDFSEHTKTLTVEPGLYWNLKGDDNTDDPGRGITAKYSFGYDLDGGDVTTNKLSLTFRWNF
ncbi:hypothetical protein FACS189461_4580 [Spirochaetia bacterium]|nr:hypothetical protein FACS189461_4580 [Spirochaetia bacterium]